MMEFWKIAVLTVCAIYLTMFIVYLYLSSGLDHEGEKDEK